jgi:hypothetical protein
MMVESAPSSTLVVIETDLFRSWKSRSMRQRSLAVSTRVAIGVV